MAILSTVKKVIPYIKEAAGYVLCHISSQAVEMDDGTLLQDKIESMDSEIDGKANTSHTHDNSDIIGLTPDKAVISSGSGELTTFNNVTSTEVGYLEGVTSNIQDQIDTLNSNLSDLILDVKYLNVTTDQYGKVDLPIETLAVSVYPNSSQYGIFQYANNSIRVFDVGTGILSFVANKKIDIYVVCASIANLE